MMQQVITSLAVLIIIGIPSLAVGQLRFSRMSHNFGDVLRGEMLRHSFQFRNNGTTLLRLQGVHAACGCTVVQADEEKTYESGESGEITVQWDTSNFSGSQSKVVTVMTDSKVQPHHTLRLRAKIKEEMKVTPPLIDLGKVKATQVSMRQVRISPAKMKNILIERIAYNEDIMDVSWSRHDSDFLVNVRLKPTVPQGFLKEAIYIHNNSQKLPILPVPVRAFVAKAFEVTPSYLEFGAIKPQRKAKKSFQIKSQQPQSLVTKAIQLNVKNAAILHPERIVKVTLPEVNSTPQNIEVELVNLDDLNGHVHGSILLFDSMQKTDIRVDFYSFFVGSRDI